MDDLPDHQAAPQISPLMPPDPRHSGLFDFLRSSNLLVVLIRIVIFVLLSYGISSALQFLIPRGVLLGPPTFSPASLAFGETIAFLGVFAASFLMSRLERREFGEYGLPARRDAPTKF